MGDEEVVENRIFRSDERLSDRGLDSIDTRYFNIGSNDLHMLSPNELTEFLVYSVWEAENQKAPEKSLDYLAGGSTLNGFRLSNPLTEDHFEGSSQSTFLLVVLNQ